MLYQSDGAILIVDDDGASRHALAKTLTKAGYRTRESDNGIDALKLLHVEQPALVLLDFEMPQMDGAEVLKQLPERTDNLVFVEMTEQQRGPYLDQQSTLARLVSKKYLTEVDRRRVLCCIANMRMLCDSTFLFDKQTNSSPKLVRRTCRAPRSSCASKTRR